VGFSKQLYGRQGEFAYGAFSQTTAGLLRDLGRNILTTTLQAAERILIQTGGLNMNTWVVGNLPLTHQIINHPQGPLDAEQGIEKRGEKVFYMKSRIMAGRANLEGNKFGLVDYKWASKEEVQEAISARDWAIVRGVLAER